MEWILYILGGIFLLGLLAETGIMTEFFTMIMFILMSMGLGALICWLIVDVGSPGYQIGGWIGFGVYLLYCISRIVAPDESIIFYEDGSSKKLSTQGGGIAGIVMLVLLFLIWLCN